jgi:LuxR family transcriptional regulator, maltose regulon positive regulatory protein
VVLDDYHVIGASDVHEAVTFLLDNLPDHVHLVMATRSDPPLPLARLRSRGQLS